VKFRKSDKIQFISTIEGLESIEECLPKPAKHFIPKWFKDIPNSNPNTVKTCPSFPDYFSQGYIIPMWADVILKYDKVKDEYEWRSCDGLWTWETHANEQFLDYIKPSFNGVGGQFIFKPQCPWRVVTPPGWSVLQLPLFYHFNKQFSVLPGIIDTDIHSIINQQVLYHGDGEEIMIRRGDPFALYIPFKRSDKLDYEISYQTEKNKSKFSAEHVSFSSKFRARDGKANGEYRRKQRERDKRITKNKFEGMV